MKNKNSSPTIIPQSNRNSKNENHSHQLSFPLESPHQKTGGFHRTISAQPICPHCQSTDFIIGAGKKPGQMSLRCNECKAFIGYRDIGKLRRLQKLHRQKRLTECLSFIERHAHLSGQAAIFILSEVGQVGGEV